VYRATARRLPEIGQAHHHRTGCANCAHHEGDIGMKHALARFAMFAAFTLASLLAGCVTSGQQQGARTPLSPTQCGDLTALRQQAPLTRERNDSEMAALEEAGYRPKWGFDPYYPRDLDIAQRRVDSWYQAECPQAHGG
jgi:hypothetical protein